MKLDHFLMVTAALVGGACFDEAADEDVDFH